MPFAMVNTVRIDDMDKAREGLHGGVIPFITSLAGFVTGTWAADADAGKGVAMIVFDGRENAQAAVDAMKASGIEPPGVTIESSGIYEVQGQA